MYRTVEPRTVIVSRVTVSRDLGVYLTARRATFMRGETEVMVPLTIVPGVLLDLPWLNEWRAFERRLERDNRNATTILNATALRQKRKCRPTILELDCDSLILALHKKPARAMVSFIRVQLRRAQELPDELHDCGSACESGKAIKLRYTVSRKRGVLLRCCRR